MTFDRKAYMKAYIQQKYVRESHTKQWNKWRGEDEIQALKAQPCADCGKQYPYWVMDFDHRPGEDKVCDVGGSKSRAKRLAEAKKCDIVCSNCHRERTHNRVVYIEGTERFTATTPGSVNRNKTHCNRGHAFTVENTYSQTEGKYIKRRCRQCRKERKRK